MIRWITIGGNRVAVFVEGLDPVQRELWQAGARAVFAEQFGTLVEQGDRPLSPDAHSVRFSEMTTEAEAELAEWDRILHGRTP